MRSSTHSTKSANSQSSEDESDLRRGPWTVEEDLSLINYIATHGEGRWNSLARCAGNYIPYDHTNNNNSV